MQLEPELSLEMVNPFIRASVEVLDLTCQTQAKRVKTFARPSDFRCGDISAAVPMKKPELFGCMALGFHKPTFLALVSTMFGENYSNIDDENKDAIGEIVNQIFGKAKSSFADHGLTLEPAIPCITVEENHGVFHAVQGPCVVTEFSTDAGAFFLELSFSR